MSWLTKTLTSSIGRKLLMGLTGLFLVSFLFVHLIGNFKLFLHDDGEAFNHYSHFMSTNPVIRIAEWILLTGFVLHIYSAWALTRSNAAARPVKYVYQGNNPGVSWFSKNMGVSGSIVLIFLITHLVNFYGAYHYGRPEMKTYADGEAVKDMYGIVATVFKEQWWISLLYVVSMVLLGFHLNHGFQSAFRTLGIDHKKYTPAIITVGVLISILVPAGFASMPIYFLVK
jgi:succinate dehydrogenase / fumarate reductase cytochrome b subunit